MTCADNDQIVMLSLRHGTAAASLGADDDLAYLVTRVRAAWPNVRIHVRGDGGFCNPTMYEVSDRLEITYTYAQAGEYTIVVKVIDILGNDTTKGIPVEVK